MDISILAILALMLIIAAPTFYALYLFIVWLDS